MENDYLLVLSGRNVFRELELSSELKTIRVGTTQRCDVRFRKEMFFSPFEIEFIKENKQWSASCSEEVYFNVDNVRKLAFKKLEHGDLIILKYANSDTVLFNLNFLINFERECGDYDRSIDLSSLDGLTMGGMPNCDLYLNGGYTDGDLLALEWKNGDLTLTEHRTRYGAYCNGIRIKDSVVLEDKSFFSVANFYFYYHDSHISFSKTADIIFNNVPYIDDHQRCITSEYPRFNRNTRIKTAMDDKAIPILDPPEKPEKPKKNIILTLLPAVGMLAITVLLRSQIMSSMGNNGFIIMSACMISVGILTSVLGIIDGKRQYKKDIVSRKETYEAYIEEKKEDVKEKRSEELAVLNRIYPSPEQEYEMVIDFAGNLFERRIEDEDFLDVRLGVGAKESVKQLDYKPREKLEIDELAEVPMKVYEEFRLIDNAPIALKFAEANAVGVVGPPSKTYATMKNMVIDICTRQYESDVKILFVVEPENEPLIHWARNLPHVQNEDINSRNIVCDDESKNVLFEYLYKVLTYREADKDKKIDPRFVIFVIDECGLKNHPLSKFIDKASSYGMTFVFFEPLKEFLPLGCDHVVVLDKSENTGEVIASENDKEALSFTYTMIEDTTAAQMAEILAPVYCEEVSLEGTLTKSISLFEMFEIIAADDLNLKDRWARSAVHKSLAAPLGVSKNKMIHLDLSDKAHGPHGLVAGTTGSGKSEILQTYILSMATLFHPHEVGFVIIDFKGGGMVNQFRDLPHLIGAITNIDGREIDRSLKSIKAELKKRQKLFADADVNHINNYIRLYQTDKVSVPLPHLIIIVDEFAELKAEQPEFMKELISASRIGRSLGVHLILATQKPAGQVNEQIWSNSRFKLCLKVQSKEDSNEVLKSPLAAEIKEPGRAYLQVGNNEIFELFQSAFSGAPEHEDNGAVKTFTIYQVENSGKRVPVFAKKKTASDSLSVTQLDAVVNHVANHCAQEGIDQLSSICLPPLPDTIQFPDSVKVTENAIGLGFLDDPDTQFQGEVSFDIFSMNTFVVGSSQFGKTNFIQTVIRALASNYSPSQTAIYIMDFGSMVLKNFEELHHVGGVVIPSEDEKLKSLFKLINEEIQMRKKRLLEVGVSSFSSYLDAGYSDYPRIQLIIDNFAVFKELYAERFEDDLLTICREGIAYGISVIIANSTTNGFGYKFMSNFASRIAFRCNDSAEYGAVFDRCKMEPKGVPGRALCSFDKEIFEFQSYLSFEGEKEIDRVKNMKAFNKQRNERFSDEQARVIPSVPDDLNLDYIYSNYEIAQNEIAPALEYNAVEPVRINLDGQFSLGIVGGDEAKRASCLEVLFKDIEERCFDRPVEVSIIDDFTRRLGNYKNKPYVKTYSSDYSVIDTILEETNARLTERFHKVSEEGVDAIKSEPYLITIVNSSDAMNHLSEVKESFDLYSQMSKRYASLHVLFVFGNVADTTVAYSAPALFKELKESRKAFVLSNLGEHKFFDVNAAQSRAHRAPLEEGQAFYFNEAEVLKTKIAIAQ